MSRTHTVLPAFVRHRLCFGTFTSPVSLRSFAPLASAMSLVTCSCLVSAGSRPSTVDRPNLGAVAVHGTVVGRVLAKSGEPLAWVAVMVEGTQHGASTLEDGSFRIERVPAGTWNLVASHVAYQTLRHSGVTVRGGEITDVSLRIAERVRELQAVEVIAGRHEIHPGVEVKQSIDFDEAAMQPVLDTQDIIQMQAGTLLHEGELHIRGLRSSSVRQSVDGVAITDPQAGAVATLASRGLEAATVTLGGLGADVGQASGLIEYQTKEGGREFAGEVYYITDDYGSPENTYDNLDRVFLGVGGPGPVDRLTFYVGTELTYADWYPATPRERRSRRLLEFLSLGDRQHNQIRVQSKVAYRPTPSGKLTAELIRDDVRSDQYEHMWSRPGYVQLLSDTTQTGAIRWLAGRFSSTPIDSSYAWYNPANHTPTSEQSFSQVKLVWNHTLSSRAFYAVRLSRNTFEFDERVRGKHAWEYDGRRYGDFWLNYADGTSEPYFVLAGDYPRLNERQTKVTTVRADYTHLEGGHTVKTGLEASYNDMRAYQVELPFTTSPTGEIGERSQYHYYNVESAAYVMDRWAYEGMELNFGMRLDVFSVGDQLTLSEVDERVKAQWSPRVGIAYPISDRDVFSFHYGRFYQIPQRQYLYDRREATDGRAQGNPNLTNETTLSYQAAVQHLFNNLVSAQFSVYYTDVFGQISTDLRPAFGSVGLVRRYVNRDYASSRGFEVSLKRRFDGQVGFGLNYTFGVAAGTASDPDALVEQNFVYVPTSEQPLEWDVRHKISVSGTLASGDDWLASAALGYESGVPYTPVGRDTRETLPSVVNSRRLPSRTSLDVQAERYFSLWGQRFKVFVQGDNVLDAKNISRLDPANWPSPTGWNAANYVIYYAETGRTGGAYIGADGDGDGRGDWVALNDPRVLGSPRAVRTGFSFAF